MKCTIKDRHSQTVMKKETENSVQCPVETLGPDKDRYSSSRGKVRGKFNK